MQMLILNTERDFSLRTRADRSDSEDASRLRPTLRLILTARKDTTHVLFISRAL